MAATHKNMTVTRTISAGNFTGASLDSDLECAAFPFARRHSSAGIRALMWATASACSFGSSVGSECRSSKDSIRSIVVTPDSIPQFTIPKLAIEDGYRYRSNDTERQGEEEEDWGSVDDITESYHAQQMSSLSASAPSSSSGFGSSPCPGRRVLGDFSGRRVPTQKDCSLSCPLMEAEHCSDPASIAALSLPHLPKVTTPYGFITLSKSPQMANEEALFFQTGHRRWGHDEEVIFTRHPKLEMKRSVPVRTMPHASTPPHQSPASHRFCRRHSVTEIELQRQLAQRKDSYSTPVNHAPVSKSKRSLWGILRKHLKIQKETLSISI